MALSEALTKIFAPARPLADLELELSDARFALARAQVDADKAREAVTAAEAALRERLKQ